jgi:transcriptional regulator with XRE-family HTH domain
VQHFNATMDTVQLSNLSVRDLRERAGLTQRDVSVALDVRTSTISDWERGIFEPRLPFSKVRMLIGLYKCTFDELADAFEVVKESKLDRIDSIENEIKKQRLVAA